VNKLWLPGALLLALLACSRASEEIAAPIRPVTLERVETRDLVDRIEAIGELIPEDRAVVAAEVAGRVTEILIDEGQAAGEGDAVLAIDPERRQLERDSAAAGLDQARARLREAEREHQRMVELRGRRVASDTQLDAAATELALARSALDAAQAELGMRERALSDANVRAPFGGLIALRQVSRGEFVAAGQPLFELVALDPIQVEFRVNEVDSGRVQMQQRVGVRVAPYPDEVFDGTVSVVSPTIDERSRTLRVKADIDNSDGRLRPGLFARVDLGVSTRRGVPMVPEEAVLQRADGAVVFIAEEGNRVRRVAIETGVHRDGSVEVVSGVAPGALVVVRGQAILSDGDVVDPRTPAGGPVEAAARNVAAQELP
jgi:membrane fusion protein (multidrug efflux system)